nr:hypothetical protein CFP56_36828 [Quercus suber]
MAGSSTMAMIPIPSEQVEIPVREKSEQWQWEIQFSRFFNYPPLSSTSPDLIPLPPKLRNRPPQGTWISSSSSSSAFLRLPPPPQRSFQLRRHPHRLFQSQDPLIGVREHMKKRPPVATAEKVQQFVKARGKEAMVAGFYHDGYEEPLLMLMKRRGVHSGLVVKGAEGALSMTTRLRSASISNGFPVNYCSSFRSLSMASAFEVDGVSHQNFNLEVNAMDYGFEPTNTPRTDRSLAATFLIINYLNVVFYLLSISMKLSFGQSRKRNSVAVALRKREGGGEALDF